MCVPVFLSQQYACGREYAHRYSTYTHTYTHQAERCPLKKRLTLYLETLYTSYTPLIIDKNLFIKKLNTHLYAHHSNY